MIRWLPVPVLAFLLTAPASASPAGPIAAGAAVQRAAARPADLKELLKDPLFREKLKRWRGMSDAERRRLKSRYEQWKLLPELQRNCIRMSWARFRSLQPEQQVTAKQWYRQLSPKQRQGLKQYAARAYSFARMHQIPLHHFTSWVRSLPQEEIDGLKGLPPDRRAEAFQGIMRRFHAHVAKRFEARLPEAERKAFRSLPLDRKMARVRKWYADRKAVENEKRGRFPWWERPLPAGDRKPRNGKRPAPDRKPAGPPSS